MKVNVYRLKHGEVYGDGIFFVPSGVSWVPDEDVVKFLGEFDISIKLLEQLDKKHVGHVEDGEVYYQVVHFE